jgi:hypothetical protein
MKETQTSLAFPLLSSTVLLMPHEFLFESFFFASLLLLASRAGWACHNFERATDEAIANARHAMGKAGTD